MTIIIVTKDDDIVNIHVTNFPNVFSKNIIDHTLENSRGVFQAEGKTEELLFTVQGGECRFHGIGWFHV